MDDESTQAIIPLAPGSSLGVSAPQLTEMRDPFDDWTGVTSTAERKRRQNRLHQRAYRKRHRPQQGGGEGAPQVNHQGVELWNIQNIQHQQRQVAGINDTASTHTTPQTREGFVDSEGGYLLGPCPRRRAEIRAFIRRVYEDYSLHAPRPGCLTRLIQVNVLNALSRNAIALGFAPEGLCTDDYVSPFHVALPSPLPPTLPPLLPPSCPENLHPTIVQRTVRHHPWIDLFPIPRMRDNMLRGIAAGLFEEDELCLDLVAVDGQLEADRAVLIVWGEAWDPRNWEASVPFLRKWGGLVRGCPEILEATNYWREKRGERKILFRGALL